MFRTTLSGHGCARFVLFAGVLLAVVSGTARGIEPPVSKSAYHLFHPVPEGLMRDMSTDRPDKTESPFTLDAGHFQIEMDLASYAYDRAGGGGTRTDAWAVAPINIKAGLFNDLDVQLVIETWNHVRTKDLATGNASTRSGFGDITLRLKKNLLGNDGGRTALAVMPFVKFPTNQDGLGNDSIEGGVIVPLAVDLGGGWGIGGMTEVDILRDESGRGNHVSFINTVVVGCDFTEKLGAYVEFFSEVSTESGSPWVGTVDIGFTWGVTKNIQLDAGINVGVTKSADDLNPFLGLSWRY